MAKTEFDELMSVGIDIGKDTFHIVGFDPDGKRVLRKQIKRLALIATFEGLPRSIVGMEACLSAHFVSRTLRKLGFEPRIIPAIYVKPFNKGQKNDYNDAEAIAEAALRPNLSVVSEKNQKQLDLQALHRVRSRLVSRRCKRSNRRSLHGARTGRRGQVNFRYFCTKVCFPRFTKRACAAMNVQCWAVLKQIIPNERRDITAYLWTGDGIIYSSLLVHWCKSKPRS
nr:transposase [Ruegeria haliotis]